MRFLRLISGKPGPDLASVPDLHTQLESLFDCVWRAEAEWRFDDRLAMALRIGSVNSRS